jgi:hypothetical protein
MVFGLGYGGMGSLYTRAKLVLVLAIIFAQAILLAYTWSEYSVVAQEPEIYETSCGDVAADRVSGCRSLTNCYGYQLSACHVQK